MTEVLPGQLDLFTAIEEAKLDAPAPTLYGSPTRGLAARAAEFAAWRDGARLVRLLGRSHAWTVCITCPDTPTERCQPTVLSADLRCDCDRYDQCSCVGDLMYRGACRHCDWEGEPHERRERGRRGRLRPRVARLARACPSWRPCPRSARSAPLGSRGSTELYPAGWLEDGGPIRTRRTGPAPGTSPAGPRSAATTWPSSTYDDEDDQS